MKRPCLIAALLLALTGNAHACGVDIYCGLIGWWTMDSNKVSGTTYTDSTGNNNGTATGSPTSSFGIFGQAVVLNGTSQFINVGNMTNVANLQSNFSVSVWYKYTSNNAGFSTIVSKSANAANSGWLIGGPAAGANQNEFGISFPSNVICYDGTISAALNTWHHGVITLDGSGHIVVYRDGASRNTCTNTSMTTPVSNPLYIGALNNPSPGPGNSSFFPGNLDDVRIYSRVLSAPEVRMLYYAALSQHINIP